MLKLPKRRPFNYARFREPVVSLDTGAFRKDLGLGPKGYTVRVRSLAAFFRMAY